jgi:hypothetical protein
MKKEINPVVAVAIVVVVLLVAAGLWIWQPWGPHYIINTTQPTDAERARSAASMRASMMESMQARSHQR